MTEGEGEKALPWLLAALVLGLLLYLFWWRPRVLAEEAAAAGTGGTGFGTAGYSSALHTTGGAGDVVRKFDNFGTSVCPAVGAYFGAKIGGSATTVCNYSRVIDPTHYLHKGIAKVVDWFS